MFNNITGSSMSVLRALTQSMLPSTVEKSDYLFRNHPIFRLPKWCCQEPDSQLFQASQMIRTAINCSGIWGPRTIEKTLVCGDFSQWYARACNTKVPMMGKMSFVSLLILSKISIGCWGCRSFFPLFSQVAIWIISVTILLEVLLLLSSQLIYYQVS